ncbi:hypothetical protein ADICYQ_2757 [Cyclobacterium qasimii M12-11B]|uniref:Uncharacterized protein n=1 Tax=Cyclobacterium qasimii M12-11B TaxID=641524 RepID=S7VFH7_9BACT|nr:hypothetical protein ADICYQ_2757 [Cyclobacterium qasimii M12-11B]
MRLCDGLVWGKPWESLGGAAKTFLTTASRRNGFGFTM